MKVRWTTPASRDFVKICNYIQEESGPARARSVGLALLERIESLVDFPHIGRPGRRSGTRELATPFPFIAVYRLKSDEIVIVRILHGAQKWPPRDV
jgi:toxin ParE1/3/4